MQILLFPLKAVKYIAGVITSIVIAISVAYAMGFFSTETGIAFQDKVYEALPDLPAYIAPKKKAVEPKKTTFEVVKNETKKVYSILTTPSTYLSIGSLFLAKGLSKYYKCVNTDENLILGSIFSLAILSIFVYNNAKSYGIVVFNALTTLNAYLFFANTTYVFYTLIFVNCVMAFTHYFVKLKIYVFSKIWHN